MLRYHEHIMLISFTFENTSSFKDRATLTLIAASALRHDAALDARATFPVPGHPHLSLLNVAAIYGANASGKSNIVRAFRMW
jgi:AAA15 family ATPase/GTPase